MLIGGRVMVTIALPARRFPLTIRFLGRNGEGMVMARLLLRAKSGKVSSVLDPGDGGLVLALG